VGLATIVTVPGSAPDGEPEEPAGAGDGGDDPDDEHVGRALLSLGQQY
jgi:hypothetical protein